MSDERAINNFFSGGGYKASVMKRCVDYQGYPCYAVVVDEDASALCYCLVSDEGVAVFERPYFDGDAAEKERIPEEYWDIEDANGKFFTRIFDAMDEGLDEVDGVKWADYIKTGF